MVTGAGAGEAREAQLLGLCRLGATVGVMLNDIIGWRWSIYFHRWRASTAVALIVTGAIRRLQSRRCSGSEDGQGEAQHYEIAPVEPRGSDESAHGARISVRCRAGLTSFVVLFLALERLGDYSMPPGHPPSIVGDGAESAGPDRRRPQAADALSCLRASRPSRGVGHLGGYGAIGSLEVATL